MPSSSTTYGNEDVSLYYPQDNNKEAIGKDLVGTIPLCYSGLDYEDTPLSDLGLTEYFPFYTNIKPLNHNSLIRIFLQVGDGAPTNSDTIDKEYILNPYSVELVNRLTLIRTQH